MPETVIAWQVCDHSDEHTWHISTHASKAEADKECERVKRIMKFRGHDPEYIQVDEFILPEFGPTVADLEPGEMMRSTTESAFRKVQDMLDLHHIGAYAWHREPVLTLEDWRYEADKRNRSLPRLAELLEYARARCMATVPDNAYCYFVRDDIRDQYAKDDQAALEADKPRPTIKEILDAWSARIKQS